MWTQRELPRGGLTKKPKDVVVAVVAEQLMEEAAVVVEQLMEEAAVALVGKEVGRAGGMPAPPPRTNDDGDGLLE